MNKNRYKTYASIEKQQEMWFNDWECNKVIIRFNLYGNIKLMDEENAEENSF